MDVSQLLNEAIGARNNEFNSRWGLSVDPRFFPKRNQANTQMSSDKKPIVYPDFLAERYTLLRELGQGAYGIVR
jgi:hypothetical protein